MSYYVTPHDKSRYRYIPIDFFECVDIITSINLALGCCFALPSNCMEEKQLTTGRGLCTLYDITTAGFHNCVFWHLLFLKSGSSKISHLMMGLTYSRSSMTQ